ncbi:MAG TPA: hypothetical protein ENH82_17885 [bacterium]|nr:hypothetical protein [bacterium]
MTTKPPPLTTRQDMKVNVRAYNKYLHEKVGGMTDGQLLGNCHPADRSALAWQLHRTGRMGKRGINTIFN